MTEQYKYLFTPLKIGPVTVRNRVMFCAHGTGFVDANRKTAHPGCYGERYAYYLADRAKGGLGLIIFGVTNVHPTAGFGSDQEGIATWDLWQEYPKNL